MLGWSQEQLCSKEQAQRTHAVVEKSKRHERRQPEQEHKVGPLARNAAINLLELFSAEKPLLCKGPRHVAGGQTANRNARFIRF